MNDKCAQDALGNCQHIDGTADLWTIPSGTHYFFGHTVSGGSSSDSPDTKSQRDDVTKDLDQLFTDSIVADPDGNLYPQRGKLLQALVMYIVARDDKVLEHGRRLGQMEVQ